MGGVGLGTLGLRAEKLRPKQRFSVLAKALSRPCLLAFSRPVEDPNMAVDCAVRCVLGDLTPVNSVARPGMQTFLARYAKGVLTRAALSGAS